MRSLLNSMKAVNKNLIIILVFMVTVLSLFINKLTTPRTLSNDELLINGLFLFDTPKEISDFEITNFDMKTNPRTFVHWSINIKIYIKIDHTNDAHLLSEY